MQACKLIPTSLPSHQMRVALQNEDGTLPGFMRVYDCVVVEANDRVTFTGMTMEKLQGRQGLRTVMAGHYPIDRVLRAFAYFNAVLSAGCSSQHLATQCHLRDRRLGGAQASLGARFPQHTLCPGNAVPGKPSL